MKNLVKSVVTEGTATNVSRQREQKLKKVDSVTLIYVPLYFGGRHRGTSMGPAAVRVAELVENIQSMGLKVAEEIEIHVPYSVCWLDSHTDEPKCVPEIRQVSEQVAAAVEMAMQKGTIPVTIGGDHSLAIGSLAGASSFYRKNNENFGLVWFDAHGDINTPETSYSKNVHGMPLAVALGHGDPRLTNLLDFSPKVDPRRTVLIGIRDIDQGERGMIDRTGISAFTMRDLDHLGVGRLTELSLSKLGTDISGIHLSFDIDVMDPDTAPGVSVPAHGGLNYREATLALTLLAETGLIRSVDMVELNPACDNHNRTAELAVELITTSLGKRIL